jgi:hypothetical protein
MLENLMNTFGEGTGLILTLLFFTIVIAAYSVFVFYFYRFLAKKNIIELNLNQYNQYSDPTFVKVFAAFLYVVEYIIILPVLTFFWFSVLAILILLLAKGIDASTILLISVALVAAVRVVAYLNEDLSRDLAKMLPFTLIAIAITTPDFFDVGALLARVADIPSLFSNIPYYLLFIIIVELAMRVVSFFQSVVQSSKVVEEEASEVEEVGVK